MQDVDTSQWECVGRTANSVYFEIEPGSLLVVPDPGSMDDGNTARENQAFQEGYFRRVGLRGVTVILFDRMVSQDKEARRIYSTQADVTLFGGAAMVSSSLLARAMVSFFMGLSRPRMPTRMFPDIPGAIAWAHEHITAIEEAA